MEGHSIAGYVQRHDNGHESLNILNNDMRTAINSWNIHTEKESANLSHLQQRRNGPMTMAKTIIMQQIPFECVPNA